MKLSWKRAEYPAKTPSTRNTCHNVSGSGIARLALAMGTAPVLTTPTFGQLLLCAAVKDLEELDDRLFQARIQD